MSSILYCLKNQILKQVKHEVKLTAQELNNSLPQQPLGESSTGICDSVGVVTSRVLGEVKPTKVDSRSGGANSSESCNYVGGSPLLPEVREDSPAETYSVEVKLGAVGLAPTTNKEWSFKVEFSLSVTFGAVMALGGEQPWYDFLEKIVRLIHAMEFYYSCHVSNQNIVAKFNKTDLNMIVFTFNWESLIKINSEYWSFSG